MVAIKNILKSTSGYGVETKTVISDCDMIFSASSLGKLSTVKVVNKLKETKMLTFQNVFIVFFLSRNKIATYTSCPKKSEKLNSTLPCYDNTKKTCPVLFLF